MQLNKLSYLLILLTQLSYAQTTEEKINNFFLQELVFPYTIPAYNTGFIAVSEIASVEITVNDSLDYQLVSGKENQLVLLDFNTSSFYPAVKVLVRNTSHLECLNFYKDSLKQKNYQISEYKPYTWVKFNGATQKIIRTKDSIGIEQTDDSIHYFKHKIQLKNNRINKIRTYINPMWDDFFRRKRNHYTLFDTKKYKKLYKKKTKVFNYINDTLIEVKEYKPFLISKSIYFFDKNGKIIRIRVTDYIEYFDHGDYIGYDYIDENPNLYDVLYTYKYDSRGNWIERIGFNYKATNPVNKITRKISYKK